MECCTPDSVTAEAAETHSATVRTFNSLLGSLLRLDVDHGDPYAIPADNPFVGQANHRGEVWAKGLRNPWRYTFDAPTSLLYIADVGQDLHEEVDVVQPIALVSTTAGT